MPREAHDSDAAHRDAPVTEPAEHPSAVPAQSATEIDAEVAQELAAESGSSPAKYGSRKGKDHNA